MIIYIVSSIPHLMLIIYILYIKRDIPLEEFGIRQISGKEFLLGGAVGALLFGLLFLFSLLLELLSPMIPEDIMKFIQPGNPAIFLGRGNPVVVILFALATGYKEELFFRSYLLTRLRQVGISWPLSVAAASLFFGVLHVYEGVVGIFFAAASGVLFSLLYIKFRSLHIIALGHAIFNGGMLLLYQSASSGL